MQTIAEVSLGVSALTGSFVHDDPFIQNIHSKVMETITKSESIPGFESPVFNTIKGGIIDDWNVLVKEGVIEKTAPDKEVRSNFVALQAIVEHVLAYELSKTVKSLTGVIHTPMPATPLCTKGSVSAELVDSSIIEDPSRLFTVQARTTIVRDYLEQGGDLYIVYPEEGMTQRNEMQQEIYKSELEKYPAHLFDRPLNWDSFSNDLVGAFYVFKNTDGKSYAFAIKMTQANSPQELGSYGLWFGEYNKSPVYDRVSNVLNILNKDALKPIQLPY
jgi:hypothetical protein